MNFVFLKFVCFSADDSFIFWFIINHCIYLSEILNFLSILFSYINILTTQSGFSNFKTKLEVRWHSKILQKRRP